MKRCPFCDGASIIIDVKRLFDEDQVRCGCEKVTCMGSHFHSPDFYDEKEMIRRWDERA